VYILIKNRICGTFFAVASWSTFSTEFRRLATKPSAAAQGWVYSFHQRRRRSFSISSKISKSGTGVQYLWAGNGYVDEAVVLE